MKSVFFTLFLLLVNTAICTAQTQDWQDKVDINLLERYSSTDTHHNCLVMLQAQYGIVETRPDMSKLEKGTLVYETLSNFAVESQTDLRDFLIVAGIDFRAFHIINAIKVKADISLLEILARRADVGSIIADPASRLKLEPQEPQDAIDITYRGGEPEWGIKMIQADSVWNLGYTGQGTVVAGQDTGYAWDNPLLKSKYRGWDGTDADHNYHWHDAIHEIEVMHGDSIIMASNNPCGLESDIPCDDHDHGTHTMGTMVGEDDDNAIGVAPDAAWISCRCMERGYGTPTTYIECFEWFLAPTDLDGKNPDPSLAPHVINNSWGCPEIEGCNASNFAAMELVIENLRAAGIVVVVSAGNNGRDGCETIYNPASIFEGSMTVGATGINDTIANFSSRGLVSIDNSMRLKPNVVAPGRQVRSVLRDSTFGTWNGTSMAGPHVAATVALMISANPSLAGHVATIENILESTADRKTMGVDTCGFEADAYPNPWYGYGRINALKAVEEALAFSSTEQLSETNPIKVYPNPFDRRLSFELPTTMNKEYTLNIYNYAGQLLYTQRHKGHLIVLDDLQLSTGVYTYQINYQDQVYTGKVVKL